MRLLARVHAGDLIARFATRAPTLIVCRTAAGQVRMAPAPGGHRFTVSPKRVEACGASPFPAEIWALEGEDQRLAFLNFHLQTRGQVRELWEAFRRELGGEDADGERRLFELFTDHLVDGFASPPDSVTRGVPSAQRADAARLSAWLLWSELKFGDREGDEMVEIERV